MTILNPFLIKSLSYTLEYVEGTATNGIENLLFLKIFEKEKISFGVFSLL